jgi:hypothetical protein
MLKGEVSPLARASRVWMFYISSSLLGSPPTYARPIPDIFKTTLIRSAKYKLPLRYDAMVFGHQAAARIVQTVTPLTATKVVLNIERT